MSTYWGYRCLDCDTASERGFNHGEECLSEMWRLREHTGALLNAEKVDFNIKVSNGYGDALFFLEEHRDHNLVLENEYGEQRSPG